METPRIARRLGLYLASTVWIACGNADPAGPTGPTGPDGPAAVLVGRTAEDVAYLELLEAMRAAEKELDTPHGILAAVFEDRVVSRGLSPYPAAELVGAGPSPP